MLIKCQIRLAHGTNGHPGRFSRSLMWLTKAENGQYVLNVEKGEGKSKVKHKFVLKRNGISSIHMRRMSQGMITIVLYSPHVEIFVQGADKTQLESFVTIVQAIQTGEDVRPTLVRSKEAKKPTPSEWTDQYALYIRQAKDYPVGRMFPPKLTLLHVEGIGLRQLDRRLPLLSALSVLVLTRNRIPDFDPDQAELLSRLSLSRLDLSYNRLTSWPVLSPTCRLHFTLRVLNLQSNPIVWVPDSLWCLEKLESLDLSETKLRRLPEGVTSKNNKLQELKLGGTAVGCLPSSAIHMRLSRLVPGNGEVINVAEMLGGDKVLSLQTWAMKTAMTSRRRSRKQTLPWTVEDQLRMMDRCVYGLCSTPLSRFIAPDEAHVIRSIPVETYGGTGPMHSSGEIVQTCGQCVRICQRLCLSCANRLIT